MRFSLCALGLLLLVASADHAEAGVVYGLDLNDGIWAVDTVAKTSSLVFDTNLSGQINSAGYDGQRRNLFFFNKAGSSPLTMRYWNSATNATAQIADNTQLGFNSDSGNAAFYDDAIWISRSGTNTLSRVGLNYTGGTPSFGGVTDYTITGRTAAENGFGDIAITRTGMLYAWTAGQAPANGDFFRINLAAISGTTVAAEAIATDTNVGIQISFGGNSSTLYGQNLSGNWFTVDLATGARTQISGLSTVAFRDLAGSPIPEPGVMAIAGLVTGAAWLRRLRARKLTAAPQNS